METAARLPASTVCLQKLCFPTASPRVIVCHRGLKSVHFKKQSILYYIYILYEEHLTLPVEGGRNRKGGNQMSVDVVMGIGDGDAGGADVTC